MAVPDAGGVTPTAATPLWVPSDERIRQCNLTRFIGWVELMRGSRFEGYHDLWEWSVNDLEEFWASIWHYFDIDGDYSDVLDARTMPGAHWFEGARVNYARHALARADEAPALIFESEARPSGRLSFAELREQVGAFAQWLRDRGVGPGDRVVAYIPNIPEAVVAFLGAASIGAVWSSCSQELGVSSVVDRFAQVEPLVLFVADGYVYGGKTFDREDEIAELRRKLPTVQHVVAVSNIGRASEIEAEPWETLTATSAPSEIEFADVAFDHPLWILYSSGTTGLPKAIVHGHGGILLEHLKTHTFHLDLRPDDHFFWFTSTSWMMWNFLVSGLLTQSTLVLFDGNPLYPDARRLWDLAQRTQVTFFGASAPFIEACAAQGVRPGTEFDLSRLRSIGSTASPLSPDGFRWIYDEVAVDVLVGSASGGTDVCTPFVGPSPLLPVYAGELQCRLLGVRAEAYDEVGRPVVDEVGEFVVVEPMPSMPLFFWGDDDGEQLRESYFETYPGVWRHGDWVTFTSRGTAIIHGRSDSTIKRGGVRTGTSEFYRIIETVSEVADSLVIETAALNGDGRSEIVVFVVLEPMAALTPGLVATIKEHLRTQLSPRHVPDRVIEVPDVPRTLNGKKLEVPVRRLLEGAPTNQVVVADAMSNPDALAPFVTVRDGSPTA
jgi:acetoacetyl-CoA synthetase